MAKMSNPNDWQISVFATDQWEMFHVPSRKLLDEGCKGPADPLP
jgi:hypothetical protein